MRPALSWTLVTLTAALSASSLQAQTTTRVSLDSGGVQGNIESHDPSISADGRYVAFMSYATNLVAGDTNGQRDIFVRDRQSGTTERVSVDSSGVQANGFSELPALSADGRFVAFASSASNLVANDTNANIDVFLRDRLLGTTERISLDSNGVQGNGDAYQQIAISADGQLVAFASFASNLVSGDTNATVDVFLRDRALGTTTRISTEAGGGQGNSGSSGPALSADGRFVAFESAANNLVAGDTNNVVDIFVRDRQLGTLVRVSVDSNGLQGTLNSYGSALSADGHFAAFNSRAALVAGHTPGFYDIYVRDLQNSTTELASVTSAGAQTDGDSVLPSLSADGRYVAFRSSASNIVSADTNFRWDIFLRDRQNGTNERLSVSTAGFQTGADSDIPSISSDGRFIAFHSDGSDLVAGDTNNQMDIFLRDRGLPPPASFCFGDGSGVACPCGNSGTAGRGCQNSATTGGAILAAAGSNSLANDTLTLTSSGELPSVTSIFLQGDVAITGVSFGDGVRCAGGVLKRLYVHNATAGAVSAPIAGDLSIHARSAALGDILSAGSPRYYQTYYRDPVLAFCSSPSGNTWNISSGVTVIWTW